MRYATHSNLTPELTRRETTASCDKLTMKAALYPVGFNELLGRTCDLMIQAAIRCSALLLYIQFD
jgi:hypothetical protein